MREALRLGLTREDFLDHLQAPWMTDADIARLLENIRCWLRVPAEGPKA
jgi:hypothetical protein